MERLFFVGPGRFTLALAEALVEAGAVERLVVCGRHPEPPEHPFFDRRGVEYHYGLRRPAPDTTAVLLGVPDAELAEMAWALAAQGSPGAPVPVFHPSISLSSELLAPLHAQGYTVGTFHPFVALDGTPATAARLQRAPVLISGERGAQAAARRLVAALGGRVIELPVTQRASASAAEALVREGARALTEMGVRVLSRAGLSEEEAHLVAGSVMSSVVASPPGVEAPAGVDPDPEEIDLHLRALPDGMRDLYRQLLETGHAREAER